MIRLSFLLGMLSIAGLASPSDAGAAEAAPLRVGVTPIFPPLIHREGGKIAGAEVDFANVIARELGRPVKFVEVKWEDQFTALADDRTDIIMSSLSVTRARVARAAFSKPYLVMGQMPLVRRTDAYKYTLGFPNRPEGPIGLKKNTTGDFLIQQEFPKVKRKYYDDGEQGARALAKGQIDVYISDSPTIWWLEGMNEETGLVAIPLILSEEQLAWAMRKSDTALLEEVNRALEKLTKSGEVTAILKRWIPHLK